MAIIISQPNKAHQHISQVKLLCTVKRRYYMLRIDNPAPQFALMSTKGEISLETYKGKYVVLFFYPLDFTPV